MSISKLRAAIAYGLTVLIAAALSLPLAELGFRLAGDVPSLDLQGMYAPFAGENYKLGTLVDTEARLASGRLSVHTDELGLRCDAQRQFCANPGDQVDLLVIGDSQGFGNGVNFDETIPGRMAWLAAEKGRRVCNASVGGHSLASQLLLAHWLVEQQHLQVANFVLLLTPAIIASSDQLNHAVVGADGRLYGASTRRSARLRLWMKTHCVVYSRVRDALRNCDVGANPARQSSDVFRFYQTGDAQREIQARLLTATKNFRDFASAHGASVHLVYVPLTVEADFEPVRRAGAAKGLALDPTLPFGNARSVAGMLNLPLHTLTPVLQNAHAKGIPLNVKGDVHYSSVLSEACASNLWTSLHLSKREFTQKQKD